MAKPAKNTICLWYDGGAEDAARFYAETFPDSSVGASRRAPGDFPSGKKGHEEKGISPIIDNWTYPLFRSANNFVAGGLVSATVKK